MSISSPVRIRPLASGDSETVERVFADLSLGSAYLRFGTGLTRLPPRMSAALATSGDGTQQVFVAEHPDRPVGLARWVSRGARPGTAEVALEVVDHWQGRGIGRRLMAAVARDAVAAGITTLLAYVGPENARVLQWLHRLGARMPDEVGGAYRLSAVTVAVCASRELSVGCGCMGECRSTCSDPSEPGSMVPTPRLSAENVRATSSPCSPSGAAVPSPPRSSWSWCGPMLPPR